jgi:hypothetical protein
MPPWPSYRPYYKSSAGKPSAGAPSGGCSTNKAGDVKKSLHATERDTSRVHALRSAHVAAIAQRTDVGRFHFLDETGLRLDYTRRYGRAQGGRRVGGAVPLRRPARSLTLIGALSVRGLHGVQVLEGALNQHRFALYIGHILAP